jgi:hypothetical protein
MLKLICAWLLVMSGLPFFSAQCQTRVIWQIGKFDDSPLEFSRGGAEDGISFDIGKNNAATDWPRGQTTGHAYRILFTVDSVAGTHVLKVATLIDRPRVPVLQIDVNGHAGMFFLHPQLSYARSDSTFAFDPHESQSALDIEVPSSFLKPGQNIITITCMDEPPTANGEQEIGGISYDALSFSQVDSRSSDKTAGEAAIDAQPSILYHQTAAGLTEVVDTFIRFARPWNAGRADLEVNGNHYAADYPAGDFGERRISFDVREWSGTVHGRIRFSSGLSHAVETNLTAQRKWSLYVVPHTHLDIGYTDYQGKVAETQARVLTQADGLVRPDHG